MADNPITKSELNTCVAIYVLAGVLAIGGGFGISANVGLIVLGAWLAGFAALAMFEPEPQQ